MSTRDEPLVVLPGGGTVLTPGRRVLLGDAAATGGTLGLLELRMPPGRWVGAHFHRVAAEFANRELAELDLWAEFPSDRELAAGLVDVKNHYVETADEVADRIRAALEYVQPEKLTIVPDCGFSQTARWAAKAKLKSMVEGAKIVRRELAG